ncbi:MAG: transketolase C-terminal domain-containing protein [Candidatus Omnitrophica bacterium]|nr:transketolase C-terminal domain-containing protein [Candidatus Omnitrophota bacterium]
MRDAFITALTRYAEKDKNIYLLTGDLGFSVFEDFIRKFPQRFINAGIAEANMMGVAAGLASACKTAVVYSIIPFTVTRCLEQIKIDVAYQNADVKIIGIGAGFAYGALGMTHHAIEDIAVMRAFPNMRILAPCDPAETMACLGLALKIKGPFYIRLGKNREPKIHGSVGARRAAPLHATLGGSHVLKQGTDVVIFVTGSIAGRALEAAKILEGKRISTKVVSMYSIKPLDEEAVCDAARTAKAIATVEEHTVIGGLGSAVSELVAGMRCKTPVVRIGIPDTFCGKVGSHGYLLDHYGFSPKAIAEKIFKLSS